VSSRARTRDEPSETYRIDSHLDTRQAASGDSSEVLLVCTSGGHLLELHALRAAWSGSTVAWVTTDTALARSLLRAEQVFFARTQLPRSARNALPNLIMAWRLIGKCRPRALVTTGAALAVPFAWAARLRGVPVIYVESAARIESISLSCRLIAPIARRVYVQWPELLAQLPRARYAGSLFTLD